MCVAVYIYPHIHIHTYIINNDLDKFREKQDMIIKESVDSYPSFPSDLGYIKSLTFLGLRVYMSRGWRLVLFRVVF